MIVKGVAAEILDLYDRGGKPFLCSNLRRPNDWGAVLTREHIIQRKLS